MLFLKKLILITFNACIVAKYLYFIFQINVVLIFSFNIINYILKQNTVFCLNHDNFIILLFLLCF